MNRKLLLDTNILLDAAMEERPEWASASLLMDEFLYEGVTGYVSALSLKDIYYILTKYAGEVAARQYILALMDLFEVIPVDGALCRMAALSDEPDFEDGVVRACAEGVPVNFIISRDAGAFANSPIRCLSARKYLDLFCEVEEVELPE